MTGNRVRRSGLEVWAAVPITGLVACAGLAGLTAQGLDNARSDGAADAPTAVPPAGEPVPPGPPIETAS